MTKSLGVTPDSASKDPRPAGWTKAPQRPPPKFPAADICSAADLSGTDPRQTAGSPVPAQRTLPVQRGPPAQKHSPAQKFPPAQTYPAVPPVPPVPPLHLAAAQSPGQREPRIPALLYPEALQGQQPGRQSGLRPAAGDRTAFLL